MKTIKLRQPKKCSCGQVHFNAVNPRFLPNEEGDLLAGHYFNCDCGSTLWERTELAEKKSNQRKQQKEK